MPPSMAMSPRLPLREEDIDDLDDIVDQFDPSPTKEEQQLRPVLREDPIQAIARPSSHSLKEKSSSNDSQSTQNAGAPADQLPEELAKQLSEGMESLMRELSGGDHGPVSESDRKQKEAWEKMLIEGMNGLSIEEQMHGRSSGFESKDTQRLNPEDVFKTSIYQAMEKLKDSDSTLHTDASSATSASDDPLESILNQLGSGQDGSGDDDEELQGMLETMMGQLMSKEVLYEPMKELHEKFPTYLSESAPKLSLDDKTRFKNQMDRVTKILALFEDASYSEDDQEKRARIATLMNEMQSFGSPPSEIMGPLPTEIDVGPDGTPKLPEGCIVS
ncbi:Pex19 protein family-domain-containing protein [Phellopilus nigrolimitatus]|nr:Pex19 protein family-domain-containing protein [Phellopilus nigrolimitatus]